VRPRDLSYLSCLSSLPTRAARVLLSILDMEEITPIPIADDQHQAEPPKIPPEPLPPIESRFLFVDVAALRAKQLRRGAQPRLGDEVPQHHKAERVAMEEVRRGMVYYDVPANKPPRRQLEDE
jgi:DNA-directed RNA polymerase omega subunit